MAKALHKLQYALTTEAPYLALMGELWGVCCEDFYKKIDGVKTALQFM